MEFVRLDMEFWRYVVLIDIVGTVRKGWLTRVGRELGDREGDLGDLMSAGSKRILNSATERQKEKEKDAKN